MNKTHTLKELADIGAKAANIKLGVCHAVTVHSGASYYEADRPAREAFTKAILDAIGYKLPKDEEREAFERWLNDNPKSAGNDDLFDVWKAGREELRRATAVPVCAANPDAKPKEHALPEPPSPNMKVCCSKDLPANANQHGRHLWIYHSWMALYPNVKVADDSIIAYMPDEKTHDECLTAKYKSEKTEPDWIPWKGGECPLPDTVKKWEMMCRDGSKIIPYGKPKCYIWRHLEMHSDIIAYRVWE